MAKLAREQLSRFIFVSELGVNVAGGMCGVVSVGVIGTHGVIGWSCVDVILCSKENDKSVSSKRAVSGSVHCVRAGSGWGHCVRARGLGHSETGVATLTESGCFSPCSFSFGMRSKMSYSKSSILACCDLIACSSTIIRSSCDEGFLGDEWAMLMICAHCKIMDRIKTV